MNTWGVWDSTDQLWMGNDSGPLCYRDGECPDGLTAHVTAQIAAAVLSERMGVEYDPLYGRYRAKEFYGDNQHFDNVKPKCPTEEALRRLEEKR